MAMRVSTFGQQSLLLFNALQNQARVFESQTQISTGRVADDFAGLAEDAQTSLVSRSLLSRTEAFQDTVNASRLQLEANDVALTSIRDIAQDLRNTIANAIGQSQGTGLDVLIPDAYQFAADVLNTQLNGEFIFAGSRTDTPPVAQADLAALAALNPTPVAGPLVDAFNNDDVVRQAVVSEGTSVDTGLLASEIANDFFTSLVELSALGPFGSDGLTNAQVTALQAEIQDLDAAIDTIEEQQTNNGIGFSQLDIVDVQLGDTSVFVQTFIGSVEDVNIAEAVTELNNDQLALQASFNTISQLDQLTLLNFL